MVGPPAATDWSRPWHEILHDWNARVVRFVEQYSVKHWSERCLEMHWKVVHYAAKIPRDDWLARILTWTCREHEKLGRPRNTSDTMIPKFCRYQRWGNWWDVARDALHFPVLFPLPSLVLTVLLVGFQAHHRHKGQRSTALVSFGRSGNLRRGVWRGFRQELATAEVMRFYFVNIWRGFTGKGAGEKRSWLHESRWRTDVR